MKIPSILFAAGLVLCPTLASAAILASDSFSYAPGALAGANGGAGWGGAWSGSAQASVVDPTVDLNDNRALQLAGNNNNAAWRRLSAAYTGTDLYIGFRLQIPAGTAINDNDFASLWFEPLLAGAPSGDHTNRPNIGIKGNRGNGTGPDDIFLRTTGTAGSFAPGSNLAVATTLLVVGHLERGAGNYNRFDLWIDPVDADLSSPDASFIGNSGIAAIGMIGLRSANLETADRVLIDDLVLATAWNDIVAVPEPGTVALLAGGLGALGLRRRRR